jgi:HK97 gp10 family phage protein
MEIQIRVTKRRNIPTRRRAMRAVLQEYADRVEERAKELAPVDTGELRDSISVHVTDTGFVIEAGGGLPDERAKFQEFGFHHYQTGQFIQNAFLRPAVEEFARDLVTDLVAAIVGAGE